MIPTHLHKFCFIVKRKISLIISCTKYFARCHGTYAIVLRIGAFLKDNGDC